MYDISLKTLKLMRMNALVHLRTLRNGQQTAQKEKLKAEIRELLQSIEAQIRRIEETHEYETA